MKHANCKAHTHTYSHTHLCVGGYEWIITMTCRRTKAANIKRNFITFAWVFGSRIRWAGGQLPRQLCCPAAAPSHPTSSHMSSHFWPVTQPGAQVSTFEPNWSDTNWRWVRATNRADGGLWHCVCLFSFSHNYEKRYEKTQRQNVKNVTRVVWQTDATHDGNPKRCAARVQQGTRGM